MTAKGFFGVVIKLGANFSGISVNGETIEAYSGAYLSKIANEAQKTAWADFEFASGYTRHPRRCGEDERRRVRR
ncbi:MAG: hypothetical protein L6V93_06580 [Clostridiales bacterium]|nr:MAG: hypothetical protein L6V93_06580 [Clostridiales bacterium]